MQPQQAFNPMFHMGGFDLDEDEETEEEEEEEEEEEYGSCSEASSEGDTLHAMHEEENEEWGSPDQKQESDAPAEEMEDLKQQGGEPLDENHKQ